MTVASLVRKTLALNNHRVKKVTEREGKIVVSLDVIGRRRLPCSNCGTFAKVRDRLPSRTWRHVPLWGIGVQLTYRPARVSCPCCGTPKVEAIPWAMGKSSMTKELAVVLATWSRILAWDVVARLFGVSWSTVVKAVSSSVAYGLAKRDLGKLRMIGIDEISRKKGHVYHTQVYDLDTKTLVWSAEGRGKETIEAFFNSIGPAQTSAIEGICCDMWANYVEVARERAPQATLVFDKFHIVRHLLKAVNDVRKMEAKALKDIDPELLKGTRYIWLKNPGNLTNKQRPRLEELMNLNLKIVRAYLLKELFRDLWTYRYKAWAKRFLDRWFWWATHSRLKPLRDFAWMLRRQEEGILAYFDCRIDNGAVEAMNNNAKAVSHRARGYRTERAFTLSLLHCLGRLELPQTAHKFA